jgi:hypothetical protein
MNNYREQNGCYNCNYLFIKLEYDEPVMYYCNIDNNRPLCLSSMMDEVPYSFFNNDDDFGMLFNK